LTYSITFWLAISLGAIERNEVVVMSIGIMIIRCTLPVAILLASSCAPPGAAELNRAGKLFQDGKFDEAAKEYQAIDANPSWGPPYLGMGNALQQLGNTSGAVDAYRRATAFSPNWAEAHKALGLALASSGSWYEAVPPLERAHSLQPADSMVLVSLGVALSNSGRDLEAIRAFEDARRICETCLDEQAVYAYTQAKARVAKDQTGK
jgi:Flp pilus assembly protein TadD